MTRFDAGALRVFEDERWAQGETPPQASADVIFYVRERRPMVVSTNVLASAQKSKVLVDIVGAGLVVLRIAPKLAVLQSTWAALTIVQDINGYWSYRAFKGSVFAAMAKAARTDLIVYGGEPPGACDEELVRQHTLDGCASTMQEYPKGDLATLQCSVGRWQSCRRICFFSCVR